MHDNVPEAEAALRAFGVALTQQQASRLLPMWKWYGRLTADQRAEVLARFRPAPLPRMRAE